VVFISCWKPKGYPHYHTDDDGCYFDKRKKKKVKERSNLQKVLDATGQRGTVGCILWQVFVQDGPLIDVLLDMAMRCNFIGISVHGLWARFGIGLGGV
jgi:hypothetical protein